MIYPRALQNLINQLAQLPSVGPKTAERYAFYLLNQDNDRLSALSETISNLKDKITICNSCLAIAESNPCAICSDTKRDEKQICIVENIQDLIAIEEINQYQGRFFVLGGLISMLDKVGPEKLNIKQLINLLNKGTAEEMILALNFTLEGETTSLYLQKTFKDKIKITRLAKGLPAGSDLEYADQTTLKNALKFRSEVN